MLQSFFIFIFLLHRWIIAHASFSQQGSGYRQVEINSLLDLLEVHLPISSMEWERVEMLHKINFRAEDRTRELLKRKFQDLYHTEYRPGTLSFQMMLGKQRRSKGWINSSNCEGNAHMKNITQKPETKRIMIRTAPVPLIATWSLQ